MRKTLRQLDEGKPLTYPMLHAIHCFDSIREYVMCTAGEILLYTWGKSKTGNGQARMCKKWKALSQWADDHSTYYQNSETPIAINDHFGHCDKTGDGLIVDG
jgi:hypothetical protein